MGIWKQRIEGSWVRCSGDRKFNLVNLRGNGNPSSQVATAISLKHLAIDKGLVGSAPQSSNPGFGNLSDFVAGSASTLNQMDPTTIGGLMYDGIGQAGSSVDYSYIIDYFYDSITTTKKFLAKKNYQFKTHVLNFAYVKVPANQQYQAAGSSISGIPNITVKQNNGNVYYSNMNIFRGALGINPTWEDEYYFEVPYYKGFGGGGILNQDDGRYNLNSPSMPSTYILYYYSSPKQDLDSGYVAYTNRLKKSSYGVAVGGVELFYKAGTQSVYQAGYGITGVEINEIGWKMQGYSFVSYDNKPDLGISSLGITSSLSYYSNSGARVATPLKFAVLGKGWYYDDENNEYTWYDRHYESSPGIADVEMNSVNNPVGGDAGKQDNNEGYRENNYIAKYIPFQKFNLSFLYENLRTDAGIKIYLSPTLPTSKALESSKYTGQLKYPSSYALSNDPRYITARNRGMRFSLVTTKSQIASPLIIASGSGTASFPMPALADIYTPLAPRVNPFPPGNFFQSPFYNIIQPGILTDNSNWPVAPGATTSTIMQDYPAQALVNNIYVDDDSTNLKEIRINLTLRHTYIADLIINLRVPNGNVINIKAKYSGEFFNDLRNITFTTNATALRMQDYTIHRNSKADWWPNNWGFKDGLGDIEDPIGLTGPAYPLRAPWLPAPYQGNYNFNWSQIRIRPGLTFQMDKNNGQGSSVDGVSYRSNVNDLKYLSNSDNTFMGTYSLYIKDDWGGDSGILENWNIEFFYKKIFTPILALTQSDPDNAVFKGSAKLQYLFGLEGNQYLFIKGDKVDRAQDPGQSGILKYLRASLKNLKIDGGYHDANNKQYRVNDKVYGENTNPAPTSTQLANQTGQPSGGSSGNPDDPAGGAPSDLFFDVPGSGGDNTFALMATISNVAYSTYVGTGNVNDPSKLSLSSVSAKIGNGEFRAGIWENGAWNSGWRFDKTMKEFHAIDDFFNYDRNKVWRFSIFGSADSAKSFSIGDKISIGNIAAIDINEERKLIKSYFTIIGKGIDYITVEFESDFPIRRIKVDSDIHRIYISKNVWLNGGFFNGYFTGVWNNGLFQGFPFITEMYGSHWIDGKFRGGHFQSQKKSLPFSGTYLATTDRIKVGLIFSSPHRLAIGDQITISSATATFGTTKVIKVDSDLKLVVDINWDDSKLNASGTITTNISTGLIQNLDLDTKNVSTITSLQSMDSTRVFMYDSWIDVNFDAESAVNIGRPQSTIETSISSYSYSENNLFGYPTYDILASDVTFRDSFSNTIRKYRLGSKYKIYEDYIGKAGEFDEYFDVTGWATKRGIYKKNTFPFFEFKTVGSPLPTSAEFSEQGWVLNRVVATGSAISAERTAEAQDEDDVAAGKEIRIEAVGRGGVLDIKPAYEVPNRTNSPIEKLRYTMISFDLLSSLVPDTIFEEPNTMVYDDSSKYQPIIHFNNLNIVSRKIFVQGIGYVQKKLDATYLPVYKNVNHITTSKKTKVEFFYNKKNLSMFFRGNGLDGENVTSTVIDNLKLYEVDMIPFFQYFNPVNINRSVSVPYEAVAPAVEYPEGDSTSTGLSLYGSDSFAITQPSGEVTIQAESAAAAAAAAADADPAVNTAVNGGTTGGSTGGGAAAAQQANQNFGFSAE